MTDEANHEQVGEPGVRMVLSGSVLDGYRTTLYDDQQIDIQMAIWSLVERKALGGTILPRKVRNAAD